MLKIWGRSNSANVQKVLWIADELGLDYEREDVGGAFGRTKEPPYSEMNPNAVVPTLEEDGWILWESNACTRYLANKFGRGTLAPTDPRDYADADRWMDWQQTTVLPFMTPVFWGYVRTAEADRDMDAIRTAEARGRAVYGVLDKRLDGRAFIMGDQLTMADIPVAIQAFRFVTLVEDLTGLDNVKAWVERCRQTKGFQNWIDKPLT